MRKLLNIILSMWSAFTCFITPIWLTMAFLNITGLIYNYDYSMDEGTSLLIGIILLIIWIILSLIPNAVLIKNLYFQNKKYAIYAVAVQTTLILLCFIVCDWNIIGTLFI